ncbi:MAG TPA: DUF6261 family protein [Paludibacter sp.]
MKKVLVVFSLSKVRKSDFPEIMNAILAIVKKFDPVALKIVGMYNLLLELVPLLDMYTVMYDGYPIPKDLVAVRKQRKKLLGSILKQLSAIEGAGLTVTAQQAKLAVPYLRSYLKGITKVSTSANTGSVKQLLLNLEDNDPIKTAMDALGLTVYFDQLRTYQQIMNQGTDTYRENLSAHSEFSNLKATEQISNAISNLLNSIELAKVEHKELDYMPLITELNVLLTAKQSVIKSRKTRSKNSVAKKTTTVASSTTTFATAI